MNFFRDSNLLNCSNIDDINFNYIYMQSKIDE